MKRIIIGVICLSFILIPFSHSEGATTLKSRRLMPPKQSYAKQIGGNARQKSRLEYDRGNQHISKNINGGSTSFIPKDARNIRINGIPMNQGGRAVTSPGGATYIGE